MTAPVLAARVRKARRAGRCALCPGAVRTGQRIGLVPGQGWSHVACVLERQRQGDATTDVPASGGAEQEGTT